MVQKIPDVIRKLETYTNVNFPILSVYLSLVPDKSMHNPILVRQFTDLAERTLTEVDQELYRKDLEYIASFLEGYTRVSEHKGMALFSGGNKLWEVITTPFSLSQQLIIGHTPFLAPLRQELQQYERYLIILADREKTRLFTLFLGELEDRFEVSDKDVPQKVKGRGASERIKKVDWHIRDHLNRHLKLVGREVNNFVGKKAITGVIVGGHKTLLHQIEDHLPKTLQQKVIGEFVADTDEDINDVMKESKEVIRTYQQAAPVAV